MKKLIFSIALVSSTFALAQNVQFGVKGGLNVSSLSKDKNVDDQNAKIGFNAGFFATVPVGSSFSIQPELIYNNLGSKVTKTTTILNNTYTAEYSRHLDYIAVPLMLQYNVVPSFYLEAGPEFGFLISAKDKYKSTKNGNTTATDTNTLNKDNFNNFNLGVGIGLGFNLGKNVGINARYVAGTNDIYKENNGDAVKNNNLQVGLNYKF